VGHHGQLDFCLADKKFLFILLPFFPAFCIGNLTPNLVNFKGFDAWYLSKFVVVIAWRYDNCNN
jgi:hypothetical protein